MPASRRSAIEPRENPTTETAETAEPVTLYGFTADAENECGDPPQEDIAIRAYYCWLERGCPVGSPELDWQRAEEELRAEREGLGQTVRAAHV